MGLLRTMKGYTPCWDWITDKYGIVISSVFGRIWRYTQLDRGICQARLSTIASDLNLGYSTVQRSMKVLEDNNLVIDKTPTLRNCPHTYIIKETLVLSAYKVWKDNLASSDVVKDMVSKTLKDINDGNTSDNP